MANKLYSALLPLQGALSNTAPEKITCSCKARGKWRRVVSVLCGKSQWTGRAMVTQTLDTFSLALRPVNLDQPLCP